MWHLPSPNVYSTSDAKISLREEKVLGFVSTLNTNQEAKVELQSQSMKSLNFRKQNLILVRFRCRCYTLSHFEYFMLNE